MPGETDVINIGLRRIGATPIVSLSDGSPSANTVGDVYTEIRDNLLREHPWNFATKRLKLAQSTTTPVFEFDYGYALPSDWLRTISVHDDDAGHGTVLYRMEQINNQNSIVTSSDQIWLRYVSQVTDPNLMTADFRTALAFLIARDMSIPLASSNTLHEVMDKKSLKAIARARSTDSMGGFPELRPRGSWASSRGGFHKDDFLSD